MNLLSLRKHMTSKRQFGLLPERGDESRPALHRDYVESLDGHLLLERLPAYAPELNPVEYISGLYEAARVGQSVFGHDRRSTDLRTQPA